MLELLQSLCRGHHSSSVSLFLSPGEAQIACGFDLGAEAVVATVMGEGWAKQTWTDTEIGSSTIGFLQILPI